MYVCSFSATLSCSSEPVRITHVDFCILKPLLEILVDSFIGDLTDERQVRHAHLFLLGAFKNGLLDVRLGGAAGIGVGALGRLVLFAPSTFGDALSRYQSQLRAEDESTS